MNQQLLAALKSNKIILDSGAVSGHGVKRAAACNDPAYVEVVRTTSFLPASASFAQRVYCIKHSITVLPTCSSCNCDTSSKFNSTTGFPTFCSTKCSNGSTSKKNAIFATNEQSNAVDPSRKARIQQKRRMTNLALYGDEEPLRTEYVKQKGVATNMAKYGAAHYQSSIAGKLDTTSRNQQLYGVDYQTQSPVIQQKIRDVIWDKYQTTSTAKLDHVKEKARKSIRIKYADVTTYDRINDRDWLYERHINDQMTLQAIAESVGLKDEKSISSKMKQFGIPIILTSGSSQGERDVASIFEPYTNVDANTRLIIAPQELDVYLPEHKLAIEYGGLYWHSDVYKPHGYHADKYNKCHEQGIRLITLFEDEWKTNRNLVTTKLLHLVGCNNSQSVYARNCTIDLIGSIEKSAFFKQTHIQGNGPSSINLGLRHNGHLVACMGIIAKSSGVYTLNRYSTSCNVPGGFTKLLTHFEQLYPWTTIETFADLRWSDGQLYQTTGFAEAYRTPPDYAWTNGTARWHKFGFRHKFLNAKLAKYDPSLTEDQNCRAHGLYKIYDCGKIKFIKQNQRSS